MTTSGSAADLPAVKSPVLKAPAALWSWSGLYIGGHVGAALSLTDIADPLGAPIYGDDVRSPGFIGGGQIGFNHQVGSVVFGVEADVSGVSSDGTNTCFAVSGNSVSSNCQVRPDLYTTVTGRIGYAVDRTLFYAKGGAAGPVVRSICSSTRILPVCSPVRAALSRRAGPSAVASNTRWRRPGR
jgi:opacity protein-like surface antigen